MIFKNQTLIKQHEGLRLEAYMPTPDDVWTIGWGHTKTARPGMRITEGRAQELFDSDVAWAVDAVNAKVKVGLTQNQFDALVSFTFNVGSGAFSRSTLLKRLNAGDYDGAAAQFHRWNKQRGRDGKMKVLRGLTRRRAEEAELFLSPSDDKPSRNFLAENDTSATMKPLVKSKELWGAGAVAVAGPALTSVSGLDPSVQKILIIGAFLAGAGYFVWNRLEARRKGQR